MKSSWIACIAISSVMLTPLMALAQSGTDSGRRSAEKPLVGDFDAVRREIQIIDERPVIRRPPTPQSIAPQHEGSSRSAEVPSKSNQAKDGGRSDDTSARIPLKTDEWNKWKENVLTLISDRFNKFGSSKTFSSIPGNTSCEVTFVVSESGEICFPLVSRKSGTPQFDGLAAASIMFLSTNRSFSFPLKSGVNYLQCTIDFSSKDGPSNLSMKATDAPPPRNVHRHWTMEATGCY